MCAWSVNSDQRVLASGAAALLLLATGMAAVAQEGAADIIAAQIRMQGYACDEAMSAQRDPGASSAGEAAWVLNCDNAVYRVRLIPDMAARVERIE